MTTFSPSHSAESRLVDDSSSDGERMYALLTHLSLVLAHVLVPVVPALVMWLIKRGESPFLDDHGREALNFQITLVLYFLLSLVLIPICGIGVLVMPAVYVLGIVGMIMGMFAANRGEFFRYPACIRIV